MHQRTLTFSKKERLCSQRLIDLLYNEGRRMMAFPFSIQWREEPTLDVPCQLMVVAPKRRFHNAVDRNRVKRLVRESYRHLKPQLYASLQQHDIRLTLSMVYVCNEILSYDKIYQKTEKALAMLVKDIEAHEQTAADK